MSSASTGLAGSGAHLREPLGVRVGFGKATRPSWPPTYAHMCDELSLVLEEGPAVPTPS